MKKNVKKVLTMLAILLMAVTFSACQKNINVELRLCDVDGKEGGVAASVPEKHTLKDLFDDFGQTGDFTYELDSEGYVTQINGVGNDEYGYWAICKLTDEVEDPINDVIGNIALKDGDVYTVTYIPNLGLNGGWNNADIGRIELSEPDAQAFDKAMEVLVGEQYTAVQVLATQVVCGLNRAYLAYGSVAGEPEDWYIITVYEDLNGNAELKSISHIDVVEVLTTNEDSENLLGGWEVKGTGKAGSLGSAEAQASFDKALEGLMGVGYNPIQLLGTQVVEGINYRALALGTVPGNEDHPGLYVITWYEDLAGDSTITSVEKLDLLSYID